MNTSCANDQSQDIDMWAARLRSFACRAMTSAAEHESAIIREGSQLIAAGAAVLDVGEVDFDRLETMLACNAVESAVLSLMPEDTAFMLSHGAGQSCLATVIAECRAEEIICEGHTMALALLTAYISALLVPLERRAKPMNRATSQPLTRLH